MHTSHKDYRRVPGRLNPSPGAWSLSAIAMSTSRWRRERACSQPAQRLASSLLPVPLVSLGREGLARNLQPTVESVQCGHRS